jgi:TATA-box binding protein (TBP) (component of TFIID and TFIIIB)
LHVYFHHIMNVSASAFMSDLNGVVRTIHADPSASLIQTPLHITTTTVLVQLNEHIPIKQFEAKFVSKDVQDWLQDNWEYDVLALKQVKATARAFFNCLVLCFKEGSKKRAIKTFVNGTLHITGIPDMEHVLCISRKLCDLLSFCFPEHSYQVQRFSVQLINSHFKVDTQGSSISLSNLHDRIRSTTSYMCMLNYERHAGLIIKVPTGDDSTQAYVSALIFESGSILISGFTVPADLLHVYKSVMNVIREGWNDIMVLVEPSDEKRKRQKQQHSSSFDYSKYMCLK